MASPQQQDEDQTARASQAGEESDMEDLGFSSSEDERLSGYVISKPPKKIKYQTPKKDPTDTTIKSNTKTSTQQQKKQKQDSFPITPSRKSNAALPDASYLTPRSLAGDSPTKSDSDGRESKDPKTPSTKIAWYGSDARYIRSPGSGTPWHMTVKSYKGKMPRPFQHSSQKNDA